MIRDGHEPIEVHSGSEPFQVAILIACSLWGIVGLATLATVSTVTSRTIPTAGVYVFYAGLSVCSLVTLTGVIYEAWLKKVLGFYVERAGLFSLAGLCGAYSTWALAASGVRAISVVFLLLAIGVASSVRIWRITVGLKKVAAGGAP